MIPALPGILAGGTPLIPNLYRLIQAAGAQGNLACCLDAGSAECYDDAVSTVQVRDLTGNGNHYSIVGGVSHVGDVDGLTDAQYFSWNGGTSYLVDSAAAPQTWAQAWSAVGAEWTVLGVVYLPDPEFMVSVFNSAFSTSSSSVSGFRHIGVGQVMGSSVSHNANIAWTLQRNNHFGYASSLGLTPFFTLLGPTGDAPFALSKIAEPAFFAMQCSEPGTSRGHFYDPVNGFGSYRIYEGDTPFGTNAHTSPYSIGRSVRVNAGRTAWQLAYNDSGARLYCAAYFSRLLTLAEIVDIKNRLRTHRFPTLPA